MYLVTGAGGYVASHVIRALKERYPDKPIRGLVRKELDFEKARGRGFEPVLGDVTDRASLDAAMQGVEVVVHLAAINRERGKMTFEAVNTQGTINVVETAKAAGVGLLVNVVGLGADPNRPERLAASQGSALNYIWNSRLAYITFEASVVFGQGDEFISTLAGLARLPLIGIIPGDGQTHFQPIWVGDVAVCVARAASDEAMRNRHYCIAGPEIMTLKAINDTVWDTLGVRRLKLYMPVGVLRPLVFLMDKLLPKPPVTPGLLALLGQDNVVAENAIETAFGIAPRRLEEGIDYVRQITLGRFLARTLGRVEYR
jgi:uncharacterized protein YbjT (DUF2867 family)